MRQTSQGSSAWLPLSTTTRAHMSLRSAVTGYDCSSPSSTLRGQFTSASFGTDWAKPLFTVQRELCTHAHITETAGFRRCLEAGAPKHRVTDMGVPPVLARGVRVYTEPQFQV